MMTYRETQKAVDALTEIYKATATKTPEETIAQAKETMGEETVVETMAALVKYLSWDGRISPYAKEKLYPVESYVCQGGEYLAHDGIHTAHINQLAEEVGKPLKKFEFHSADPEDDMDFDDDGPEM